MVPTRSSAAVAALLITVTTGLVGVILHRWIGTPRPPRVSEWRATLTRPQGGDSLNPMRTAYELARSGERVDLYREVIERDRRRFQYSTAGLLPLAVWDAGCSRVRSCKPDDVVTMFWGLSVLSLAGAVVLTGLLGSASEAQEYRSEVRSTMPAAAGVGLAVCFYPLIRAFPIGQVQLMLDALVLLLIWSWRPGKRVLCGILAGSVAIYKPQYALLLVWGMVGGEYRFALGMAGSIMVLVITSVWLFGLTPYVDYAEFLVWLGSSGHAFFANQSVNGFLNRALHTEPWFVFNHRDPAPHNVFVTIGTLLSSILLVTCLVGWQCRRRGRGAGRLELGIALLTVTLAAPVAWEHHFGFLPGVFVVSLRATRTTRQRLWWVAGYVLTAELFLYSLHTSLANNVVLSTLFIGAVLLLGLLYRLSAISSTGRLEDSGRTRSHPRESRPPADRSGPATRRA